eukprot:1084007-Pelagomonas_calceolata.AAC.1
MGTIRSTSSVKPSPIVFLYKSDPILGLLENNAQVQLNFQASLKDYDSTNTRTSPDNKPLSNIAWRVLEEAGQFASAIFAPIPL